ncbi:hypothetical protein GIY23_19180 [Allosaccharopolyspora coralli]|uniref:AbiEi antitoxin C-terminal domain-containing protein n=1 Tax=Allosaccharopolyspora coralli TaxID=2665642 RepID=A0A5Q3Q9W7_9PSEU|nr:hypothetical protein [Allosaccharopolyspora coralli]QGK71358.1 hypothetical protein GIY23_19180 [Allosaccharopolyspora coralli]
MTTTQIASPSAAHPCAALFGVLTREAVRRDSGVGAEQAMLADPAWTELWPGVLVPTRDRDDPRTRAAAGLLRCGPQSVLCGFTALAMHGCRSIDSARVHVLVPYDRQHRSRTGLVVHQGWVREAEVQELDGLRVQALDVALTDVLCAGESRAALACLEDAFTLLPPEGVSRLRAAVRHRIAQRRDRRGTRQASGLLALAWVPGSTAADILARRPPVPSELSGAA